MSTVALRREPAPLPLVPWALIVAAPIVGGLVAELSGWPTAAVAIISVLPLTALIVQQMIECERAHGMWLAIFGAFALPQLGHFGEHLAQMVQIHLLDVAPPQAHGAVGVLDIEWVHFLWNVWVLIGVGVLMTHFRRNPWLLIGLPIAIWHAIEHTWILSTFLETGKAGDPGLLSKGGDIAGGLPLIRPDLHFIYNVLMTLPLVMAFVYELRRAERERERGQPRAAPSPG